jgi:hypothetical protein
VSGFRTISLKRLKSLFAHKKLNSIFPQTEKISGLSLHHYKSLFIAKALPDPDFNISQIQALYTCQ